MPFACDHDSVGNEERSKRDRRAEADPRKPDHHCEVEGFVLDERYERVRQTLDNPQLCLRELLAETPDRLRHELTRDERSDAERHGTQPLAQELLDLLIRLSEFGLSDLCSGEERSAVVRWHDSTSRALQEFDV